jgi:hypothetical protein
VVPKQVRDKLRLVPFDSQVWFLDPFVNTNSYPIFLFKLSVVRRFVDGLLVPDMPSFSNFMYGNRDIVCCGISRISYYISNDSLSNSLFLSMFEDIEVNQ